jgi:hypothetical protein
MKFNVKRGVRILCCTVFIILLGNLRYSAMPKADQIESDKKWKVTGTTDSRYGQNRRCKEQENGIYHRRLDQGRYQNRTGAWPSEISSPQRYGCHGNNARSEHRGRRRNIIRQIKPLIMRVSLTK